MTTTPHPVPSAGPARVVVADRRPAVREALRRAARGSAVSVVGEAATASAAVAAARALRPNLVLVDLRLPGLGDLDALRRVRRETGAAVLVLGRPGDRQAVIAAARAGAGGVAPREAAATDLVGALEALARGTAPLLLRSVPSPLEVPQEDRMVMPKVIELRRGCAHAPDKRCDAAAPAATRKG
jgi:DNA-binding NarL/FixJ family response regulator